MSDSWRVCHCRPGGRGDVAYLDEFSRADALAALADFGGGPYVDVLNAGFTPRRTRIDGHVVRFIEREDAPDRLPESRQLVGEALMFALGVYIEHEVGREDRWRAEPVDDILAHVRHELREIEADCEANNAGALLHDATDLVALAAILAARARLLVEREEDGDGP